jgi:hypothetical protein
LWHTYCVLWHTFCVLWHTLSHRATTSGQSLHRIASHCTGAETASHCTARDQSLPASVHYGHPRSRQPPVTGSETWNPGLLGQKQGSSLQPCRALWREYKDRPVQPCQACPSMVLLIPTSKGQWWSSKPNSLLGLPEPPGQGSATSSSSVAKESGCMPDHWHCQKSFGTSSKWTQSSATRTDPLYLATSRWFITWTVLFHSFVFAWCIVTI